MHIKVASVDSVIVYLKNEISLEVSKDVRNLYENIKNTEGFLEVIPSYASILIRYDIFLYDYDAVCTLIKKSSNNKSKQEESKLFEIPVYYGLEVGLDLKDLSSYSNLSIEEVISLHSSKIYNIYSLGFSPGFAFLGKVDKKIAKPRLSSPRAKIPKGSVAIANEQTSIYPNESPGGWNIIGRSNFTLYDKSIDNLTPFSLGDRIKFYSITKEEFLKTGGSI